jgi:IclR family transcriptional regulator, acetate operon repressor
MRKQVSASETSVGTLARGLDVLGLFAQRAPELSQKEISDALGLPMPTVHRLTAVLAERGYLERNASTRRFRLGLEVARLIPPLLSGLRLPEFARDHIARLAMETGETVNLAVLQDSEIVYLLSESGNRLLTSQTPVGLRLPAHCTALGKCLLAQLPDETARGAAGEEPYEKRTSATCSTWPALRRSLHRIRRDGVARSWEEYEIGLASIAVPVAWLDGPGSAAINVSLPTSRATEEFQDELVGRLRATTHRIETGLAAARPFGWTGHGD